MHILAGRGVTYLLSFLSRLANVSLPFSILVIICFPTIFFESPFWKKYWCIITHSLAMSTDQNMLFRLPLELRNKIYEELLICETNIMALQGPTTQGYGLNPGLLRTNKAIQLEAAQVLYAQNAFDCVYKLLTRSFYHDYYMMQKGEKIPGYADRTIAFLERIGPTNAGYIRDLNIIMPGLKQESDKDPDPSNWSLREDNEVLFAEIKRICTGLRCLRVSRISGLYPAGWSPDYEKDSHEKVARHIKLIDDHFKSIRSLETIVAEVDDTPGCEESGAIMRSHGWKVTLVGQIVPPDIIKFYRCGTGASRARESRTKYWVESRQRAPRRTLGV